MRSLSRSSAGVPSASSHILLGGHHPGLSINPVPGYPHRPLEPYSITAHQDSQPVMPASAHPFFNIQSDTLLVSSQAKGNITQAICGSWANSTLKRYAGSIKQYIRFCDAERVPECFRFPADEFVLCAFAASSFGRHTGGTPRSRISALKAWHVAHNVEWKGSARLRYVLNGVHNFAPRSSRQAPRPPVTRRMLSQLLRRLDINSPLDGAVAACATTAFWGQCRLGELLPSSSQPSPPLLLPTRSHFKRSVRNPQSCILRLPTTKTHRHGQDVVLVDQEPPINPITLLKHHVRLNDVQGNAHIFSYKTPNGVQSLTKSRFLQRCNAIWAILGYPRTTGHSFRIGGTTELLIAGTPPDIVKTTGRWSSESFLRYWRSLEDIAPLHIRNLHTMKHRRRHL